MSEGDVNEAFIFATTYKSPVVFFCQNNQWAISEPTKRQSSIPLSERAKGFGLPGIRVDGNDVMACHAVMTEALDRARSGDRARSWKCRRCGPACRSARATKARRRSPLQRNPDRVLDDPPKGRKQLCAAVRICGVPVAICATCLTNVQHAPRSFGQWRSAAM